MNVDHYLLLGFDSAVLPYVQFGICPKYDINSLYHVFKTKDYAGNHPASRV